MGDKQDTQYKIGGHIRVWVYMEYTPDDPQGDSTDLLEPSWIGTFTDLRDAANFWNNLPDLDNGIGMTSVTPDKLVDLIKELEE